MPPISKYHVLQGEPQTEPATQQSDVTHIQHETEFRDWVIKQQPTQNTLLFVFFAFLQTI